MSTRFDGERRAGGADPSRLSARLRADGSDPAELVALVASARRDLLLRAHRHRLRREDLEDCFSQATLELVARAREGMAISNASHLANVLEQRFVSRMHDRRRALSGRSPMQAALELALPIDSLTDQEIEIVDRREELEQIVFMRDDLRRIGRLAGRLTADQRLVLASQIGQVGRTAFCERHGWTHEKYRKVAQRARAKLIHLMGARELDVPLSGRLSEEKSGMAYEQTDTNS